MRLLTRVSRWEGHVIAASSFFAMLRLAVYRLPLLLVWLLTSRVAVAFQHGLVLPVLGVIFLPFGTLAYVLAYEPAVGVSGWGWAFVAFSCLTDVGLATISVSIRTTVRIEIGDDDHMYE
jgi:hypothetical protein